MKLAAGNIIVAALVLAVLAGALITLFALAVRALRKYLRTEPAQRGASAGVKTLGEALQEHRTACKMTQEFVAQSLGVSRQAVSKWENGAAEPSTANLLALARLYGLSADNLLRGIRS